MFGCLAKNKCFVGQGTYHHQNIRRLCLRKQFVLGIYTVMYTDNTYDLHPAEFQKHCQFSCATNGIAELADDEFIATFKGNHQLFPKRTALLIRIVFFNNPHATILMHPLAVFFNLVVVGGCHDVTYLCHNQYVIGF